MRVHGMYPLVCWAGAGGVDRRSPFSGARKSLRSWPMPKPHGGILETYSLSRDAGCSLPTPDPGRFCVAVATGPI